tara:strand:- start:218 stop:415 length:198 start_codon:yes stop_codon:yes gene_type:complete
MNNVETEALKEQKSDLISMVVRLQRGQKNIHQKKYKQPTVESYIETLKDYIIKISKELKERSGIQ